MPMQFNFSWTLYILKIILGFYITYLAALLHNNKNISTGDNKPSGVSPFLNMSQELYIMK